MSRELSRSDLIRELDIANTRILNLRCALGDIVRDENGKKKVIAENALEFDDSNAEVTA